MRESHWIQGESTAWMRAGEGYLEVSYKLGATRWPPHPPMADRNDYREGTDSRSLLPGGLDRANALCPSGNRCSRASLS